MLPGLIKSSELARSRLARSCQPSVGEPTESDISVYGDRRYSSGRSALLRPLPAAAVDSASVAARSGRMRIRMEVSRGKPGCYTTRASTGTCSKDAAPIEFCSSSRIDVSRRECRRAGRADVCELGPSYYVFENLASRVIHDLASAQSFSQQ